MAAAKRHMDVPQGACFGMGIPVRLCSMSDALRAALSDSLFGSNQLATEHFELDQLLPNNPQITPMGGAIFPQYPSTILIMILNA
ncbi:hypothetical protein [Marinobacter salsuginis]|nr:hypothetical protein [Marinobacter salsuginis]